MALLSCAEPAPRASRAAASAERRAVEIHDLVPTGPYLAASIRGSRGGWRFFFPKNEACLAIVREGGSAQYRLTGPFGQLRDLEGRRCEPVGVSDLAHWRDSERRRKSREPTSGEMAVFSPLSEDAAFLMVRGRFPLSLELRWPEPMDSVAFLPPTDACRALSARGDATMVFRASGPQVFLLKPESPDGADCPILGFALPLEDEN